MHRPKLSAAMVAFVLIGARSASAFAAAESLGISVTARHSEFAGSGGLQSAFEWHVRDIDGVEHTVTWHYSTAADAQAVRDLAECMMQCRARINYPAATGQKCSIDPDAYPPFEVPIFPVFLSCAKSAHVTDFTETRKVYATEYEVLVHTGDAAEFIKRSETPDFSVLRLLRSASPTDKTGVESDVNSCIESTNLERSIGFCGRKMRGCATIKPAVAKLDDCLRAHSYTVSENFR